MRVVMLETVKGLGLLLAAVALMSLGGCPEGTVEGSGPCETDGDCPAGRCLDGACSNFCETDFDCPVGSFCIDRTCQVFADPTPDPNPVTDPNPNPGADPTPNPDANPDPMGDCAEDGECPDSQHCEGGACVDGCHNDNGCMVGQVCDVDNHTCVAAGCMGDGDCPGEQICDTNTGLCTDPLVVCAGQTCAQGEWCDHFSAECISELPGELCTSDSDCAEGRECAPSNDADDALQIVCREDLGEGGEGDVCADDGECRAGLCVFGVCYGACEEGDDCALEQSQCRTVPVTPEEGFTYEVPTCLQIAPCTRDADCGDDEVCGLVPVGEALEAICVTRVGAQPAGAPCSEDSECASGACFGNTIQRCLGVCAEDGDCSPGNTDCQALTFLLDDGGTPDDPDDDRTSEHPVCEWSEGTNSACANNGGCNQEICALEVEDDVFVTQCRPAWGAAGPGQACEVSNDCQSGLCLDNGVCYGACVADPDCLNQTSCESVPVSEDPGAQEIQFCVPPAPVCTSDADCDVGQGCLPVVDPNNPDQVVGGCVTPPNEGGALAGQACTVNGDCASDFCMDRFGGGGKICYGICEVGSNAGCNDGTVCYPNWVYLTFDQDTVQAGDDRYDSTPACLPDFGGFALCGNDAGCGQGEICYPVSNRFWNAFETRCIDAFNPGGRGRGASCTIDTQCASNFCVDAGLSDFCFTVCASSGDCDGFLSCLSADLTVNDRGTDSTLDDITDGVNLCQ